MPRFFLSSASAAAAGDRLSLTGEDARHIALSLRARQGEEIWICDGAGLDCRCVLEQISPDEVVARVAQVQPSAAEPPIAVTLYQCLPKGERAEWIIQKATELGVSRVVFLLSERCVSRPDEKSFAKKCSRFQRIAEEAAKQSGRGIIPQVTGLLSFREALAEASAADVPLFCYEGGGTPAGSCIRPETKTVSLLIGPEGGFSDEEAALAVAGGMVQVSLGRRILRTETAPLCALSILVGRAEEWADSL